MTEMDPEVKRVAELIELMEQTGVTELCLELPSLKVQIKRGAPPDAAAPVGSEEAEPAPAERGGLVGEQEEPGLVEVTAPAVGTFHHGGAGGPKTRLAEGDRVEGGQLLAAVEAMGVAHEVRAPTPGVIERVPVMDEEPVEYGQVLFLIRPDDTAQQEQEGEEGRRAE